jgi:GSH-dependent disulfide-bond oxidoreductase
MIGSNRINHASDLIDGKVRNLSGSLRVAARRSKDLITLYTWATPNGRKVSIMLEEIALPYAVKTVNISKREQFDPAFAAISPSNKIPAIVDEDANGAPLTLFESGAILIYLADKTGRLLPPSGPGRAKTLEWLHWQIGGLDPTLAQFGFFALFSKEKIPQALDRFSFEADRLLGVMDRRLAETAYLAGPDFSIADVAAYPWASGATILLRERVAEKPHIVRWLEIVGGRPAVQRGMAVPKL